MQTELNKVVGRVAQLGEKQVQNKPTQEDIINRVAAAMKAGDTRTRGELLVLYDANQPGMPLNEAKKEELISDIRDAASLLIAAFDAAGIGTVVLMFSEKGITVAPPEKTSVPKTPEKQREPSKERGIKPSDITPQDEVVLCGLLQSEGVLDQIQRDTYAEGLENLCRDKYPAGQKWPELLKESVQLAAEANENKIIRGKDTSESFDRILAFVNRIKVNKRGWGEFLNRKRYWGFNLVAAIITETGNSPSLQAKKIQDILQAAHSKSLPITTNGQGEVLPRKESTPK